ncbi:TPA: ABC transporter permease [Pseudomonas aeruginosa]|jgi:ABC-2 type transport system permease protein|uniref:Membrane protein n=1 Tax=Sphingobium cupriresistens LL01 TaxID=1420583 RepID=A0A0J7XSJ9_9SPHN|nr:MULTISPECIES: ABC transporter permease [Alphaproteobacteria]KMS54652.1 membrane protein [Sphingobium cupriresistens LL01]MBY0136037.1 ABC transporter permease [Paracoccus yeei]
MMSSASFARLSAIIVKELWAVFRDPRARITLIAPPLLQLVLFGFAATLEVRNFDVGVLDRDSGIWSHEIVSRVAGSPNVGRMVPLASPDDMREAINNQQVIAVLSFDSRFSAAIEGGQIGEVQIVLDGRRSNASQIVSSYLQQIIGQVAAEARPAATPGQSTTRTVVTNWFNPALIYLWFVMPALLVTLGATGTLSITAQSVARERELGTFDQLMVSPLRVHEILIGKMAPPLLIGFFNATLYVILIPTVFGVPLTGSVASFYFSLFFYVVSLIGVGMLVSTLSQTQQQAFLGMFLVTVPLILLSGFATPVDNMPGWLQVIAFANPCRHFLVVSEGVFLKDMPAAVILANTWPLAAIASVTLTVSAILFRARME